MIIAAILGAVLYTIIGVIPGTDETAVIAPVTLGLVLIGISPAVILAFFISAIISKKLTDSIPVAVAGIPGGVMAAPMVEKAVFLKKNGLSDLSIKKMASGSVIGTIVSVPVSLFLAKQLMPYADTIKAYSSHIFLFGAIFLALMSNKKVLSLISIFVLSIFIQGVRNFYWFTGLVPQKKNVFISFFLAITIGIMISSLFDLLFKKKREEMLTSEYKETVITDGNTKKVFPNPFRILDIKELLSATFASIIGSMTFFMSPIGMTSFLGEAFSSHIKDPIKKASRAISTMDALSNATYVAGTLIPLIAIGLPLSPMSLGPALPLFDAAPVFTTKHNMHHILEGNFVLPIIIGAVIAILITYPIAILYSEKICKFVFEKISHEALLGLFFGIVVLIAYKDAGVINIAGVLVVGLLSGYLNKKGVNYGVQFMSLYCAKFISVNLLGIF